MFMLLCAPPPELFCPVITSFGVALFDMGPFSESLQRNQTTSGFIQWKRILMLRTCPNSNEWLLCLVSGHDGVRLSQLDPVLSGGKSREPFVFFHDLTGRGKCMIIIIITKFHLLSVNRYFMILHYYLYSSLTWRGHRSTGSGQRRARARSSWARVRSSISLCTPCAPWCTLTASAGSPSMYVVVDLNLPYL